jgi:Fic family protein
VPDPLGALAWSPSLELTYEVSQAEAAVRQLDERARHLVSLETLSRLLLRSESISSSRIEGLVVGHRRLAEALFDAEHSRGVERSVAGHVRALAEAIEIGSRPARLTVDHLLRIHRTLLEAEDPSHAGRLRDEQVWIGGGATPRTAEFVPPPEDEVRVLLDDLIAYCNREDIPALVQAAIAHAQFETIHPFVDGNGRVGRCLVQLVLRRRGLVERYVPPISVVLATNARAYVAGLTDFREHRVDRWVSLFANATHVSVDGAERLVDAFTELQQEWRGRSGTPRRNSSTARLIAELPGIPIVDVSTVAAALGVSYQAASWAVANLEEAGVLRPLRPHAQRNRVWSAPQVFGLLDGFEWVLSTPSPQLSTRPSPRRPAPSPTTASRERIRHRGDRRT